MAVLMDYEFDLVGSRILGGEERVIWLDIETKKVDAPEGWGYKRRWYPFMVAVCGAVDPGIFFVTVVAGTEEEICDFLEVNFEGFEIRYCATRDFDEMVLKGRFTNARRALASESGSWKHLREKDFSWNNRRKVMLDPDYNREADVESKDVPKAWDRGERTMVAIHCARDVIENALLDPEVKMTKWLRNPLVKLMMDYRDFPLVGIGSEKMIRL